MKKEYLGTILAVIAAVISGISIPANKLFVVDLDPTVFTALRAVIIGTAFLIIASFQAKFNFKKIGKANWKYLIPIAVIGGAIAFMLFFNGLKLTTAGRGAFLQKTLPLFVVVLSVLFLKEKLTRRYAIAVALMFAGMMLIYLTQIGPASFWQNPSLGDALVLAATFLWGIEAVLAKKAMLKGDGNFIVSFARMLIGGIVIFCFILLMGNGGLLLKITSAQLLNILVSTSLLFGYVFCWFWSIKLISASKASATLLMAPVISLAIGVVAFGEPLPFVQVAGSVAILVGAFILAKVKSEFA
jgi:drug/metabolite transporter (DMT)-like permease